MLSEDSIGLIVDAVLAIIIIVANIIQIRQSKKMSRNLDSAQVIIKDTNDIRKALSHELEGYWRLSGFFSCYQNEQSEHYSDGWLDLTWNPEGCFYNAHYVYCVTKTCSVQPIVTAICEGSSSGDIIGLSDNKLVFTFRIVGRTSSNTSVPFSKNFKMVLVPVLTNGIINTLTSIVSFGKEGNESTKGILTFNRVIT